ncbi:hypothetical protein VQ045_19175 [Aurantimonas sp. E1-2-R+4]|uniref:hypothetical protein n=1 Tax=Aurantimonas sp. E1-2-R+4 TaxID=3113714 RepID=UPI002F92C254
MMPPVEILRECFDYDPITGALTWRVRPVAHFQSQARAAWWNRKRAGTAALGTSCSRYGHRQLTFQVSGQRYKLLTHRIAWTLIYGFAPTADATHWNRDASANMLRNLRETTRSQTARDALRHKPGLKGAYRGKRGKWTSCVWVNGRHVHLGTFPSQQAAHDAWILANVGVAGRFFNAGYPTVFD